MDSWKAIVIFALPGLLCVGIGVTLAHSTFQKVKTVASWPIVPGHIVESAIRWEAQASRSARSQSHLYAYRLHVRTDYNVEGHHYSSTTPGIKEILDVKVLQTNPWKNVPDENLVRLFKQVPQGTMVPVRYNPQRKAESYIFYDLPFWDLYTAPFFVFLFGALWLLIPLGMVLAAVLGKGV